ncbi:MAG: M28 family peptidase [Candidatus Latescibacter sp.]|nr:M28 family peptidase [Candidatus Latescibacter sp.]
MVRLLPVILFCLFSSSAQAADMPALFQTLQGKLSGNRARDYAMRIWEHDKWCTFPEWKKSGGEARAIMEERGFDQTALVETPADGVTLSASWTNPIAWDVKQATLEVIEPANLPDEMRYLCNWLENPSCLNIWSGPTPPGGVETELVLMESSNPAEMAKLNPAGKILLISGSPGGMKRYLDPCGALGFVSDSIEGKNRDFITENQWFNTWSDLPGGWLMTKADSQKNFAFSISQKKGTYLRNLLRQGRKVRVRAVVDSRYYTNDTLTSVTGILKGSGSEGEEILVTGHLNEWGANDNAAGVAAILEAVGVLSDLVHEGKLPRPKRSIRVLLGAELYGTLPYVARNLESMRAKTVAALCYDTGAENYDLATTAVNLYLNPNVCPTFVDAVFPEIIRLYYARYNPDRLWRTQSYSMGTDTYFCEPMIGIPTNWIYMSQAGHLHHNSMDTIEKVDPRTLRELSFLAAAYLYWIANAGEDELAWTARLTFARGMDVIAEKAEQANARIMNAGNGESLGKLLTDGAETIEYYTGLEREAITSILRIIPADRKAKASAALDPYRRNLDEIGKTLSRQFREAVNEKAKSASVVPVIPPKTETAWEKEASTIIPKRAYFGTLSLEGIPVAEWREVTSAPKWWSPTNWAVVSYWWCDGKRNLNEIKKLCELEAERPVTGFDLIKYYRFLEKFKQVEFVR